MRIIPNREIEERAEARLAALEQILGRPLAPPIPIELLAEKILGLDFLWEPIDEHPGETIFGGLIATKRLIILNEKRRSLFEKKPGLERSTIGHEMGHWDLFVNEATLNHPSLFAQLQESPFEFRSSPVGDVEVIRLLQRNPHGRNILRKIHARQDEADETRAVNRYAAAISMPRAMMRAEVEKIDRTQWRPLYELAEKFGVTISALRVRLEQLNLLYVDDEGALYESRDVAIGQETMFA